MSCFLFPVVLSGSALTLEFSERHQYSPTTSGDFKKRFLLHEVLALMVVEESVARISFRFFRVLHVVVPGAAQTPIRERCHTCKMLHHSMSVM